MEQFGNPKPDPTSFEKGGTRRQKKNDQGGGQRKDQRKKQGAKILPRKSTKKSGGSGYSGRKPKKAETEKLKGKKKPERGLADS